MDWNSWIMILWYLLFKVLAHAIRKLVDFLRGACFELLAGVVFFVG